MGNLMQMHDQENTNLMGEWETHYGSTFVYRGFLGGCRLMTTDPAALAHILGNAYDYPKPDFVRSSLATMAVGNDGLLTVEGEVHRKQRKILAPAFTSTYIKSLTPVFWSKAMELRDIWLSEIDAAEANQSEESCGRATHVTRIDALSWLGKATLDVIGLAGFGYAFNSLTDDTDELANAFGLIFTTARNFKVMTILQVWFPFLRRFRNNTAVTQAKATMRRIGLSLIDEKKRVIESEQRHTLSAQYGTSREKEIEGVKTVHGRDILSVLIRSNISTSPAQQMSVDEVLCQISTFLAAGHETSASALTWCLYALSRDSEVQTKLRTALRDQDVVDRILRCEYLDWIVKETLRLHCPVTSTMRVCMREEDEIPVQAGALMDRKGKMRQTVPVKKWDIITIPIQAVNKSKALWGEDALQFKPERWANPPQTAKAIPGLYANTLTFLNGNPIAGNRACIGYRFALTEIKIFLYVLVKDMEFEIDTSMVIEKIVNVVTRPFVKSEPRLGNQMPLNISRTAGTTSLPLVIKSASESSVWGRVLPSRVQITSRRPPGFGLVFKLHRNSIERGGDVR
ncbi:cytochrome P450 [Cyathus striatus]|nr:cytochrome P450 [Cyathus striatus]